MVKEKMRVLVTGGNGFLGHYVVHNLIENGHEPMIFDRKRLPNTQVSFFLGDVTNPNSVSEAVNQVDGVIHLAGVLGTSETIANPLPAVATNIYGSLTVFKSCQLHHKPAVYISVGNYWMNNSYSITKTTAEKFAWMFNRELGTKIAVVRALNAYGPGQKDKPVRKIIPNFIIPALKGEEINVYGDGSQVMDMVYAPDVADVLVRALTVEHDNYIYNPIQNFDASPKFDVGTGRSTTVLEIAELVIKLVGSGSIKHVPMRKGEPENSVVVGNPETLKPLYGGEVPELVSLEKGLAETIDFYKGVIDAT